MSTEDEIINVTPEGEKAQSEPVPGPAPAPNPTPTVSSAPQPLSPADERTWAMLAHLSVLLNLITGFLGVGAALLIYLMYKERSKYVAYQAMQSFLFQLIFWAGGGVLIGIMWAFVGALSAVLVGILLIPFALILTPILLVFPIVAVVYGVIGSIQCSDGKDFRYWLVSDWALNLM